MKTFASLIGVLLVSSLLAAILPLANAAMPPLLNAPPAAVAVTVDGVWSAGEWADAPQYAMGGPAGQTGFIRAKFNATHLFVLIDSPWDTTPSTVYYHENVWLAFDTLNDGGSTPLADDYMIHASTEFTQMGWQGYPAGGNWTMAWLGWAGGFACTQAGGNFGAIPLQASPNSAVPHRITEFAVPLNLVGYPPSTVGFYVLLDDDSTDPDGTGYLPPTSYAEWPLGSGGTPGWPSGFGFAPPSAPMAWGDLILAAPPVVHDVAVTQIEPLKTVVGQTYNCGINVTLVNQGASSETFDVTVYANDTVIGTKTVALGLGSSAIITFDWNTSGFVKTSYVISAYAWPIADEVDTGDNMLISGLVEVVTPGDVNADGTVNVVDAAGVSAHWYPGPPIGPLGYDSNFDINGDGAINILDAALVSAYWTGPPKGPLAP